MVLSCHDIFVKYKGGILLVKRNNSPAKNILWPIGGRIKRGVETEKSLIQKVKQESNLDLKNIKYLGVARTFFETEPFGHRRGTDSINLVYFGEGIGKLKLDDLHEEPTIFSKDKYKKFKQNLHPYIRDFMDLIF